MDSRNLNPESGSASGNSTRGARLRTSFSRRAVFMALTALALLAAGLGLYRFRDNREAIESLAILPLVNEGADPNLEYLSDGITENLIDNLSRVPHLRVMSGSSVSRYKGKKTDAQSAGGELGVRAILTGRTAQQGNNLQISLELMDVRDNRHLWGEQYNRSLADLPLLQEEISRKVSEELRLRLSGEEKRRLLKRGTANAEAYQRYLKGRFFRGAGVGRAGEERAIAYYREATELDPNYALAYAALALAYNVYGGRALPISVKEEMQKRAKAAVAKALELDDTLAEAHDALAVIRQSDWEWEEAEREYKRSIDLNPNNAGVHQRYAQYLSAMGRPEEALAEIRRSVELDPFALWANYLVGHILLQLGKDDQARDQFHKLLELDPYHHHGHSGLGWVYLRRGQFDEAIAEFELADMYSSEIRSQGKTAVTRRTGALLGAAALGYAYAVAGKRAEARKLIAEMEARSQDEPAAGYIATIYAGLGDREKMFEWLEKGYIERSPRHLWFNLRVSPEWDPYRSDPRFIDLMRRTGLLP